MKTAPETDDELCRKANAAVQKLADCFAEADELILESSSEPTAREYLAQDRNRLEK